MSTIKEVLNVVDKSINDYMLSIPEIEQSIYKEILKLTKELSVDKSGKIKNTIDNYRILSNLRSRIEKVIFTKSYEKNAAKLIESYDEINTVIKSYFATFATSPSSTTEEILKILRNQSIERTLMYLGESGVNVNIIGKVQDILQTNITSGGSYADFIGQLKTFIRGDQNNLGAFSKYAQTIVVDGLQTYSRTYTTAIAEDIGVEWYQYTGSLLETSREWCKHMVKKKWVHKSELATVIYSNVDGVDICSDEIPCNAKTKLPRGMKKETNENNILNLAGGWQCGHIFIPVSGYLVPENIRSKFTKM